MKIKLGQIKSRHQALCMVAKKDLPAKLSYYIGRNILKLQEEFSCYEKMRVEIAKKFAQKDENGEFLVKDESFVFGENEKVFDDELKELNETEIDISFDMVSVDILDLLENERYDVLSPVEMVAIDFMIENPQGAVIEETEPKA